MEEKTEPLSCYGCSHFPVCEFFKAIHDRFRYKDDSKISGRIKGIAICNAEACANYQKMEDLNGWGRQNDDLVTFSAHGR